MTGLAFLGINRLAGCSILPECRTTSDDDYDGENESRHIQPLHERLLGRNCTSFAFIFHPIWLAQG
jgi:hypothetical protein